MIMKKVFNNSHDVIHLFVQQSQEYANCSNVFFEHKKLYSYGYHYLLAELITNDSGQNAIMIDDRGYSVTTAKHISQITQASRQFKQFFTTQTDAKKVLYTLECYAKSLQTAHKPEKYILPAQSLFNSFNEWLQWSNKYYVETLQIIEIMKVFNGSEYSDYLANKQKAIKKAEKEQLARDKKTLKENVKKFNKYEINTIYKTLGEDFLRISKDSLNVETSQGAKVSIKEAQLLYKMIVAKKDIKGHIIGSYTVISINGVLKIGCHNINMKSVHEIGQKIINL